MKKKATKKKAKKKEGTFLGQALVAAAEDALAWHKGQNKELRVTDVKIDQPPVYSKTKIKQIRAELNVSQAVFAGIIGCSPGAVKAWEQGDKKPNSATMRLLQILSSNKKLINDFVQQKGA